MTGPVTQIFVASQDAGSLVLVAPPYTWLALPFLVSGLACWLVGVILLIASRPASAQGQVKTSIAIGTLPSLLALVIGTPFVAVGLLAGCATWVTVLPGSNELKVQRTLLAHPIRTRIYALDRVRAFVVGTGDNCFSLQAAMADGHGERLISCTDRTGYHEVASAINAFLTEHRGLPQHEPAAN